MNISGSALTPHTEAGGDGVGSARIWTGYSNSRSADAANQVFCLFPALNITVKGEKGVQVPNPDSLILAAVKSRLGL